MLTYDFVNLTKTSAELVLNWEKKQFPVKIEYDVDDIVINNLQQELKGQNGFNPGSFTNAANYALANKVDLPEGLTWIDRALATNKTFANLTTRSNILRAMDKPAEADKVMTDALPVATELELNAYGYQLLTANQQDKAIEIFILNTQKNPKSPNVWDSLGEGYALKGDKKNAIINFKKSLSLNPPAAVKANSEKYLKQLGAM
jgi:tetratricopeptide (TPR) repeat protein